MKHRAIIREDKIQFIDRKPDLTGAIMVDVEFLGRVDTGQADTLHPVSQKVLQFMGGIQGEEFDWKDEWHRHLDEKYE